MAGFTARRKTTGYRVGNRFKRKGGIRRAAFRTKGFRRRRGNGFKAKGSGRSGRKRTSRAAIKWSQLGDQQANMDYIDRVGLSQTNNTVALDLWHFANAINSTNTVVAATINNLHLDDPFFLHSLMINAQNMHSVSGIGAGLVPRNVRICRKRCTVSSILTNAYTAPIHVVEYRLKARQNIPHGSSPYQNFLVSDDYAVGGLFQSPLIATASTAGAALVVDSGVTPFMNHGAMTKFKVTKVRRFSLREAQSKRISYTYKKPRLFSHQQLNQQTTGSATDSTQLWEFLKGQSFSLFTYSGSVGIFNANDANFRVGQVGINVILQNHVRYSWCVGEVGVTTSSTFTAIPGIQDGGYIPRQIVTNVPAGAVSTGPVPAAAGTFTFANPPSHADVAIPFDG